MFVRGKSAEFEAVMIIVFTIAQPIERSAAGIQYFEQQLTTRTSNGWKTTMEDACEVSKQLGSRTEDDVGRGHDKNEACLRSALPRKSCCTS
jgi:hypothetical protein